MAFSASTTRNLSLQHMSIISLNQGCCSLPHSAVGVGPESAASSFEMSLCTYLLSSCQLWSTSSACSTCTGSSCLCLLHTVGWTWEEIRNKTWSNQPGISTPLTLSRPKWSPRLHWFEPWEEPKVCKKWIESMLAWPSSSSSPPPFLPAGSAAISAHPPWADCDGFGCEIVTVTQVVLVPGNVGTPSPTFKQLLGVCHWSLFDPAC